MIPIHENIDRNVGAQCLRPIPNFISPILILPDANIFLLSMSMPLELPCPMERFTLTPVGRRRVSDDITVLSANSEALDIILCDRKFC